MPLLGAVLYAKVPTEDSPGLFKQESQLSNVPKDTILVGLPGAQSCINLLLFAAADASVGVSAVCQGANRGPAKAAHRGFSPGAFLQVDWRLESSFCQG